MTNSGFDITTTAHKTQFVISSAWLTKILQGILMISVPVLLVIGSVRLVMNPTFLQIEYTRPGFPEDRYGFSTEDRLQYGPYGVLYLLNDENIDYLADLSLPADVCYLPPAGKQSCSMFNERELGHMEDVKAVTQSIFSAANLIGVMALLSVAVLAYGKKQRFLQSALMRGSLLTLSLIVATIAVTIAAWDVFFNNFHAVFFEDGTWRFFYSDTLIRLYPEQFWFDASLLVGVVTTMGAGMLLGVTRFLNHRLNKQ